ncbi:MAG: hypothetical protein AAFU60_14910, partial [Bacteroidota bacterium]
MFPFRPLLFSFGVFSLCGTVFSCSNPPTAEVPTKEHPAVLNCQLPRATDRDVALGIPKVEGLAPSTGV